MHLTTSIYFILAVPTTIAVIFLIFYLFTFSKYRSLLSLTLFHIPHPSSLSSLLKLTSCYFI